MEKIFSLSILLAMLILPCQAQENQFKFPTKADYPKVHASGATAESFVPKGWKVISQATGDLNGDKLNDIALVVKAQNEKYIQANSDMGVQIFDTNPRMLIVLFKNKNGYTLGELNKTIIPIADGPTMDEPFKSVAIKKNVLELSFTVFYSAGSWFTSNSTYKFKYSGQQFELIGADVCEVQRNSGEQTDLSYNFLSNKLKVTSNMITGDDGEVDEKPKVKWRNLPHRKLKAMSTFLKLYEWSVLKDCNL
jgi:hypothetical protein